MQYKNTSKSRNSFWPNANSWADIVRMYSELGIPNPFTSEEDRQQYLEFLKRRDEWARSPDFHPCIDYDGAYDKERQRKRSIQK